MSPENWFFSISNKNTLTHVNWVALIIAIIYHKLYHEIFILQTLFVILVTVTENIVGTIAVFTVTTTITSRTTLVLNVQRTVPSAQDQQIVPVVSKVVLVVNAKVFVEIPVLVALICLNVTPVSLVDGVHTASFTVLSDVST